MSEHNSTAVVPCTMEQIEKLANQYPDFCRPVFDNVQKNREEILKQLSAQMPNVINVIQTANGANAYKVVGNLALQQGNDGFYSAVLRNKDGTITQHVKLEKSLSDGVQLGMFAYTALNAAIGQLNMLSIAKRLEEIETQLDEAKNREYAKQYAAINSACEGLKEVCCLSDSDHQRQTVLDRRNDLRTALDALRSFIKNEIEAMPEYHEKSRLEKIFSNWGLEKSTLPMKAKKRFECVVKALPVWCKGMSFLTLTDPYVGLYNYPSADKMTKGLQDMFELSKLRTRVVYVPLMGNQDPIKLVDEFVRKKSETEKFFENIRNNTNAQLLPMTLSED